MHHTSFTLVRKGCCCEGFSVLLQEWKPYHASHKVPDKPAGSPLFIVNCIHTKYDINYDEHLERGNVDDDVERVAAAGLESGGAIGQRQRQRVRALGCCSTGHKAKVAYRLRNKQCRNIQYNPPIHSSDSLLFITWKHATRSEVLSRNQERCSNSCK